ncbi:MAG TPA: valine--tRNA ligase [Candidatus Paceibacterota bacterium]|nr:valine--tRNA ligase [Candidatus Paceibacterota bacterium]
MSSIELPKTYDPSATETDIYRRWEQSGFFNPDTCVAEGVTAADAKPFIIAMPPPNVTGTLHLGHVFEHALQDTVIRYHRMRGRRTLWIPGTDHAAIATNAKYEKILAKEGKSRHDFTREEYFRQVNEFALDNQQHILGQLRIIGDSVDWSRLAFTLDEERERAVRTAFKRMYDEGLIYRGNRIVNWDPKGQTTISDDEIIHEETKSSLYTFRYAKDFPIPIATTRPETKVGDVAVAVHPDDERYRGFVGKTYSVVFADTPLEIRIIADKDVDPTYGTGAVGVTPAHSLIDWELAERHDLPFKKVINEHARMENVSDMLNGKKVLEARELVVRWLKDKGLLEKEEEILNNISKSDRTGGIIEPLPKLQWFVDVDKEFDRKGSPTTLKSIMRSVVESGDITVMPEHFRKIYMHWVENLRDWCISRQILYGHRIPVWYRGDDISCDLVAPKGDGWIQDEDTLDTWFSSGLWTFSTLGWPDTTDDLRIYHPTTVINPGYEILTLWVSRMIMLSGYLLDQIPFHTAYFHGIVRDKDGRKFSKSLNNGIDPLDVTRSNGTDALRMSLIVGVGPGSDLKFDLNKVKGYRNFANKLWNIARFVLMSAPDDVPRAPLTEGDALVLEKLAAFSREVTDDMEALRLYMAGEKIYHYIWHTFADDIIEAAKPNLKSDDAAVRQSAQRMLRELLMTSLKLLHPFMPFVTEELWGRIHGTDDAKTMLMVQAWPVVE